MIVSLWGPFAALTSMTSVYFLQVKATIHIYINIYMTFTLHHINPNTAFTQNPSLDGAHWLCTGRSWNALWVNPIPSAKTREFFNFPTFQLFFNFWRIRRPIGSSYAHTQNTLSNEIALCNTTRENTWIRQKAVVWGSVTVNAASLMSKWLWVSGNMERPWLLISSSCEWHTPVGP